ncbi:MAG: prepilin-type N-terminal cleavage/methylation domain-containing protein [Nitrospirae bacterium]|nr:MAG: prepilin-type N-terminal cleavage/methylation domain-containing protein [Nitrospirota bacterium]
MHIFSAIARFRNTKGFTLIELSIVLIIIGIIMGLGLGVLGPTLKGAKVKQAEGYLDNAIESVVSFGMTNKRLPSYAGTDEFTPLLRNPNDPWGQPLYYIYDNDTANSTTGGICGRKTTKLRLQIVDAINGTKTIDNVSFIIFSSGASYSVQQTGIDNGSGVEYPGSKTVTLLSTAYAYSPLENPNTPIPAGSNLPFDDIVKWVTLSELRTKIGCQGGQLKIINNDLPSASLSSTYSTRIYADGGTGASTYQWCWYNNSTLNNSPGLVFSCNGTLSKTTTPNTCNASGSWNTCDNVTISGTPSATSDNGSHIITFAVRDGSTVNNNYDNKSFVLTVGP